LPKAKITLASGATVSIEGTPEEVAGLVQQLAGQGPKAASTPGGKKTPQGPVGYIRVLKEEGFFKTKKMIGEIQKKLEEQGHIYGQGGLSPALVKLVRSRTLRRLKEDGVWKYVNP